MYAAATTTIMFGHVVSVQEQLYNFVAEFREMKPTLFNQTQTWQRLRNLLDSGAQFNKDIDINTRHRATEVTMLYCAVRAGSLQTAYYLLDQGANPNMQDNILSNTPLHTAAEKGYTDCITKLCAHGANLNAVNREGQTPLHAAVLSRQTASVTTLLSKKAQKDIRDKYGRKPLDYAKAREYEELVKLLS
jgi:ankyrin repeat protein